MQTNNQTKEIIRDQIRTIMDQLIKLKVSKGILDNIPETDEVMEIPADIISEVPELVATGNSVLDKMIKRVFNYGSILDNQISPDLWALTTISFIYAELTDHPGAIRTLHDTLADPISRQQLIEDAKSNTLRNLEEIQKGFDTLDSLKNQIENIKIPEEGDEMYTVDHVATDVASVKETVNDNLEALKEKYTKALEQAFEEYENIKEENMNTDMNTEVKEETQNTTTEEFQKELENIRIVSKNKNMFLYLGSAVIAGAAIGIAARKLIDYYAEQSA